MFLALLVIVSGLYIHGYSQNVKVKHGIEEVKQKRVSAKVANAELKKQLYQMTDPATLEEMARQEGLILERKPEYISYDWR